MSGTGLWETFNRKLLISKYTGAIVNADVVGPVRFAVIFDAGSTGSRVHVFRFNATDLELLPIGPYYEFNNKTRPGLSSYANNPEAAADSLRPLLREAESLIPTELQSTTPVRLGATAGLRLLSEDTAERILQAVRKISALKEASNTSRSGYRLLMDFRQAHTCGPLLHFVSNIHRRLRLWSAVYLPTSLTN